jgi:cysteate synthase
MSLHFQLNCLDRHDVIESARRGFTLANPAANSPALLRVIYNEKHFTVNSKEPGLFRYRAWLPVHRSLAGAGGPVAYRSESLAQYLGMKNLYIVFSGYWPEKDAYLETCSFKELEALSVLSSIPEGEDRSLVVSSAGNTGRSFLQVASRYGLKVTVVVPERALPSLWCTMERHSNVRLVVLTGKADYFDAIRLGEVIAQGEGYYPEGGVRNVARRDGMASTLLAVAELIGDIPMHYVQAVGSGTGGIGAWEMVTRLKQAKWGIGNCRLHLVQNSPFTIMTDAWQNGTRRLLDLDLSDAQQRIDGLYATVLSNRSPAYEIIGGVFDALSESGGAMYAVSREEAIAAGLLFERLEGCDLDPAAEVALAGMLQAIENEEIDPSELVALNLTGGGRRRLEREGRIKATQPDVVVNPYEVNTSDIAHLLAK